MEFGKIQFGFASAEKESANSPDLLINGFVDFEDAFKKAVESDEFLFLGCKGSGKTAIGKRLALESRDAHNIFNNDVLLGDFPFTSFSKIIRGSSEPEAKYPTAWAWLLLLYVYRSLDKDAALQNADDGVWSRSISALRSEGLLSGENIAALVKKTTRKGFKVGIAKFGSLESVHEANPVDSDVSIYVDTLKEILKGSKTPNRHYVTVDGFDDIVTKRSIQLADLFLKLGD